MHYIYWIKTKDQKDIMSEGYVGYSIDPKSRFDTHKKSKSVVGNAIRKYENDIDLVIVNQFEEKIDALLQEKQFRPKKRIGWNVAVGGQVPPDISNDISVKLKISQSLKDLKINPYCESTHSKQSIEKAIATKKKANRRMYHDPITGEYKFIALGLGEIIPDGWIAGRVKKEQTTKKIRGKDFVCNTKEVIVVNPNGVQFKVTNLKKWCAENSIPYLAVCKNKSWKGWKVL